MKTSQFLSSSNQFSMLSPAKLIRQRRLKQLGRLPTYLDGVDLSWNYTYDGPENYSFSWTLSVWKSIEIYMYFRSKKRLLIMMTAGEFASVEVNPLMLFLLIDDISLRYEKMLSFWLSPTRFPSFFFFQKQRQVLKSSAWHLK